MNRTYTEAQEIAAYAANFVAEWKRVGLAARRGMVRSIYGLPLGGMERRAAMRGLEQVEREGLR